MYGNSDFKPCLAKSKFFFVYMEIVFHIHQVADKSVYWKQAAQTTQFEAILAAAHWLKKFDRNGLTFRSITETPQKSEKFPRPYV